MTNTPGPAFAIIKRIKEDTDQPVGVRIRALRQIEEAASQALIFLHMQVGTDLAKHLFSLGIQPSGRPVSETFREMDAEREAADDDELDEQTKAEIALDQIGARDREVDFSR